MLESWAGVSGSDLNAVGENRKDKTHFFIAEDAGAADPLVRTWVMRFCTRGNFAISAGKRDELIGSNDTYGRFMSSRTSLIVKAAS